MEKASIIFLKFIVLFFLGGLAVSSSSANTCFSGDNGSLDTPESFWKENFSRQIWEKTCGLNPDKAKLLRDNREYFSTSWAKEIDLTGITLNVPRGTAITKKHVIYTKHSGFHAWPGQTLQFLTRQNEVIYRLVKSFKYLDKADLAVIQLDEELPETISPMKIISVAGQDLVFSDTPLLRLNQQSKALVVETGLPVGEMNIPTPPLDQFYEHMVTGDSSSPSILILSTPEGTIPILYSLVTYSGTGNGPLLSRSLSEIQSAIRAFGDSHTYESFPSVSKCSLHIQRQAETETCRVSVSKPTAEETEVPNLFPHNPTSWNKSDTGWTGEVACSKTENTLFSTFLKNSSGMGPRCEFLMKKIPEPPSCTFQVISRGAHISVCDLIITKTSGDAISAFSTPIRPSRWTSNGTTWIASAFCDPNSAETFTANLSNEKGLGPSCTSQILKVQVSGISPKAVRPGETLTLQGVNLDLIKNASFRNLSPDGSMGSIMSESLKWISSNRLEIKVPDSAISGPITLPFKAWGTYITEDITILNPVVFDSLSKTEAHPGEKIIIQGRRLDLVTAVYFPQGERTSFFLLSPSQIEITVPDLALSGPIILQTPRGPVETLSFSIINPIQAISLSPSSALAGSKTVIRGSRLDLVQSVLFPRGLAATSLKLISSSELEVGIPDAAVQGYLSMVSQWGTTVTPILVVHNPTRVRAISTSQVFPGESFILTGDRLDLIQDILFTGPLQNKVRTFVSASSFSLINSNQIEVKVPDSALSGRFVLQTLRGRFAGLPIVVKNPVAVFSIDKSTVRAGETVLFHGTRLDLVTRVLFTVPLDKGRRGFVAAHLNRLGTDQLQVVVPPRAITSRLFVESIWGNVVTNRISIQR